MDLLATIHESTSWNQKLKPIFNSLGTISLSVIEAAAKGVTTAVLDQRLNRVLQGGNL